MEKYIILGTKVDSKILKNTIRPGTNVYLKIMYGSVAPYPIWQEQINFLTKDEYKYWKKYYKWSHTPYNDAAGVKDILSCIV